MLFKNPISTRPFVRWFFSEKENRLLLGCSILIILLEFAIFKIMYPYPNFMPPDSYSYMDAALHNESINMWAIGYSRFLYFFFFITRTHYLLVFFQYTLLQGSLLYFLFSTKYLMSPSKWIFRILLVVGILNPLLPHISNFVSSDALFAALSLCWFTQLMWILYKPTRLLVFSHAFILIFAFMVRYNALYYPFFSIPIIAISGLRLTTKLSSIFLAFVLLGLFITNTMKKYREKTGAVQFSAFGGWQMAANALYGYAYASPDMPETVPEKFRTLHQIVNRHMDSLRSMPTFSRPDYDVSIYYLWDFKSPLKLYLLKQIGKDTITSYFKLWARVAPLYQDYGCYLIRKHPGLFLRYYAWPNFVKYYVPPIGFMGFYNLGNSTVDPIAMTWFRWKTNRIYTRLKDTNIGVARIFPVMLGMINLVFVGSFLCFLGLGGFRITSPSNKKIIWTTLLVWICNMGFSVLSAPIELRYQLFPMVITIVFLILFLAFLIQSSKSPQNDEIFYPTSDAKEISMEEILLL